MLSVPVTCAVRACGVRSKFDMASLIARSARIAISSSRAQVAVRLLPHRVTAPPFLVLRATMATYTKIQGQCMQLLSQ